MLVVYIGCVSQWGERTRIGDVSRWSAGCGTDPGRRMRARPGVGLVLVLPPRRFGDFVGLWVPPLITDRGPQAFCTVISAYWAA
jgi:hypothetical protein